MTQRWRALFFNLVLVAVAQLLVPYHSTAQEPPAASEDPSLKGQEPFQDIAEIDLEDLLNTPIPKVSTASRREEFIDLSPNVMYVVSQETIRRRGYRDLRDVLRVIPGFFPSQNPLVPLVQVRGIAPNEDNKVTYMINGHRMNNVNESTNLIWPINLDNVERIEIIVGPGSVLYGTETLVAIINLITKRVDGVEVDASYSQAALADGSPMRRGNAYTLTAQAGKDFGEGRSVSASATFAQSDGWESEAFMRHSGEKIGPEGRDLFHRRLDIVRPSFLLVGVAQWDAWTLQASSLSQGTPEYSQNREADELAPNERVRASRYNYVDSIRIANQHPWTPWLSTITGFSVDSKRMLRTIEDGCDGCGGALDTSQRLYKFEEIVEMKMGRHLLRAGFQGVIADNNYSYTINNFDPSTDYAARPDDNGLTRSIIDPTVTRTLGGFIAEEYRVLDNLTLTGALRIDHDSLTQSDTPFFSPRLAVTWRPLDAWIVKAMWNTATKYPNPWESKLNKTWNRERGADWATTLGPASRPERLTAYELQSIVYLPSLRIALNGYYQQLDDFIAWANGFTNIGDFSGFGAEFDIRYTIAPPWALWLNGAWQRASFSSHQAADSTDWDHGQVEDPSGRMNAVPALTLNLGADLNVYEGLFISSTLRYFTGQVTRRFDIPNVLIDDWQAYLAPETNRWRWETTDNVFYWDASFMWEGVGGVEGVDWRLSGKNLLNNRQRVSVQYANGDYQPQGVSVETALFLRY